MPNVLFYTLCVGFAGGVFLRSFFDVGMSGMGLMVTISIALAILGRRKAVGFASPLLLSGLFVFALAAGMVRMHGAEVRENVLLPYVGEDVEFVGRVAREPEARAQTVHLHVEPQWGDELLRERVLVLLDRFSADAQDIQYGDMVRVRGELTLPEAFATDGGREFDYPGYLRAQGVVAMVYRPEVALEKVGTDSVLRVLYVWKQRFMYAVEEAIPQPHAGLGEGVLLGVKRALGEDLDEAFRKTGIIHIVVLSGYNVLIVVEAMMYVLAYVCRPRTRMLVGLMWIVTFAFLVGMSATVVRACIMASLLLIARGIGRVHTALRGLGIAGVVMLCINPYLLVHDPGFQLSFLATMGLILFSPYVERFLMRIPATLGARGIVTATIATQIAVLPLLLYHTGMLSVVSVLVNVLVLPMVPVAMLCTFLTGMFGMFVPALGAVIGYVTYLSLAYIIEIAVWFANLSFAAAIVNAFPFWIVIVAYAFLSVAYVVKMRTPNDVEFPSLSPSTDIYDDWVLDEETDARQKPLKTSAFTRVGKRNDYEGWVIAEEKSEGNKKPEALRASGAPKDPLPFR